MIEDAGQDMNVKFVNKFSIYGRMRAKLKLN